MTEKIVTTDWVRERYADRDLGYPNLDDLDDFDAWLAEVIRAAREEGWDEGFDAGERDVMNHEMNSYDDPCVENPYRKEQ